MKLMRKRMPSLETLTGVTKMKKRIKKASGITAVTRPLRAPTNLKRRVKRAAGYESEPMGWLRFVGRMLKRR